MAKKAPAPVPAAPAGTLAIRVEKVAPVFVSRRRNSGRYDAVIDALAAAVTGEWVVIGPFKTSLEALRLVPLRGYKRVKEFCREHAVELEMHVHKQAPDAVEMWLRTVAAGTSDSNPGGFVENP